MSTTVQQPRGESTSAASTPPPPPPVFPVFPRLPSAFGSRSPSAPGSGSISAGGGAGTGTGAGAGGGGVTPPSLITRNASTSSSRSTTTVSSTSSSLVAVPIRPPPPETRTAASPVYHTRQRGLNDEGPGSEAGSSRSSPEFAHGSSSQRGFRRNGPRSRSALSYVPAISTHSDVEAREGAGGPSGLVAPSQLTPEGTSTATTAPTAPIQDRSPTTPRGRRWPQRADSEMYPRVTISADPDSPQKSADKGERAARCARPTLVMPKPVRGRDGQWSTPSSPTDTKSSPGAKHRTLSVDGREDAKDRERERRQSQASAASSSGAPPKKPSLKDFILGEELGRGSYSTVVHATSQPYASNASRPPKEYAIKIIDQAHLVAERKVKYALIERDALIRLAAPIKPGHKRGVSGSSMSGLSSGGRRKSTASINSVASQSHAKRDPSVTPSIGDRLCVEASAASASSAVPIPLSPIRSKMVLPGRRPSQSAEHPEMVRERSGENVAEYAIDNVRSCPPSPVEEEPSGDTSPLPATSGEALTPTSATRHASTPYTPADPSYSDKDRKNRKRRESERSFKSSSSKTQASPSVTPTTSHPGVIRLHSTFNDSKSLYFVLDLAKNGELLSYIRKYGSFDVDSARYYSALILDTILFMHERGVIHRDLKPENILLGDDMRTKITDFGSAKIVGKDEGPEEQGKKRSFVGSADFVSPEVLRNDPAVFASDIWAFGCVLYQLFVGRPPFRAATDYLVFQKILKKDMEFPEGLDGQAKALIDSILNLDPEARPDASEIKKDPFYASIDWTNLWNIPPPPIRSGLTEPAPTVPALTPDSDVWAVFDDEVSDGGFDVESDEGTVAQPDRRDHSREPQYDSHAAADAVDHVDSRDDRQRQGSSGSLEPPRLSWMGRGSPRKSRGWSVGSKNARTSSSSSQNRSALAGLLDTIGIATHSNTNTPSPSSSGILSGPPPRASGSSRTSRLSGGSEIDSAEARWSSILYPNEKVVFQSNITARPSPNGATTFLPTFLLPTGKRRTLVLTDLARLIEIKDDQTEMTGPKVKFEAVFVHTSEPLEGSSAPLPSVPSGDGGAGGSIRVVDVQEKGSKGFAVSTTGGTVLYVADSGEARNGWVQAISRAM